MKNAETPAFGVRADGDFHQGLTKLEYFVTHAPATPQNWFEPEMGDDKDPGITNPLKWLPPEEHDAWRAIDGQGSLPIDIEALKAADKSETFITAAEKTLAERAAYGKWYARYQRALYMQWPLAWANLMLEQIGE